MKFRLNYKEVMFDVCLPVNQPRDMSVAFVIDIVEEDHIEVPIEERFVIKTLAAMLMT